MCFGVVLIKTNISRNVLISALDIYKNEQCEREDGRLAVVFRSKIFGSPLYGIQYRSKSQIEVGLSKREKISDGIMIGFVTDIAKRYIDNPESFNIIDI